MAALWCRDETEASERPGCSDLMPVDRVGHSILAALTSIPRRWTCCCLGPQVLLSSPSTPRCVASEPGELNKLNDSHPAHGFETNKYLWLSSSVQVDVMLRMT